MQNLISAYKFTYKKPESGDILPNRSYIRQREDEEYFFYRLDANNYISLDVLLKLYHSQILRVSIGQWILLINMIYKKIVSIYLKNDFLSGTQIGELTLENIWIYTKQGFNGELNPQNDWQIIFLNYHDQQHVKFETNLNKFSLIQDHIIKVCKDTEFKIRAKLYENKLFVDQFIDILDDLFYEFQQLLYSEVAQVDNFISENVNELQETEYEYNNQDTEYISQNFEKVVNYINQIYQQQEKSKSEFEQHTVLLKWQEGLYNCMIESHWNKQGYYMTMELLDFIKTQLDNNKLSNFGREELENKIFKKMEDYGFFNFNSQTVRLAKVLEIKKQIKFDLTLEDYDHKKIYEQQGKVYEKYISLKTESKGQFNKQENEPLNPLREKNQDLILNYYQKSCQDQWALYLKFYFSINLYNKWNDFLIERLNIDEDQTIHSDLKKLLDTWFEDLQEKYQIGLGHEAIGDMHD